MVDNQVKGLMEYKGLTAQQHGDALPAFRHFLSKIRPKRILEIGTAGGGFTLFLRECLNELGMTDTFIKSFDVNYSKHYEERFSNLNNIQINIVNMFDKTYQLLIKPELINDYIKQDGITLVLCDGGNKKVEFRAIAHLIKPGDIIMAHDYVDSMENFERYFRGTVWNWREIGYEHIEKTCTELSLEPFFQKEMEKVVWACYRKQVRGVADRENPVFRT